MQVLTAISAMRSHQLLAGNPAISCPIGSETGGFASPPCDGFALTLPSQLILKETRWQSVRAAVRRVMATSCAVYGTDRVKLVGAPRFELGTPCTPCKCATRLRHAPTRFVLFITTTAPVPWRRGLDHTRFAPAWSGSGAPLAAQDAHHVFEFRAQLAHDLLALGDIGARLIAGELVARAADGEALLV